jgi:hypothetical protein
MWRKRETAPGANPEAMPADLTVSTPLIQGVRDLSRARGRPLRAIAAAVRARGLRISHEGVAGVLRSRSAS